MGTGKTSIQISIQDLNAIAYRKHRFFIIPDPAFNISGTNTQFLLEGKVRSVSYGVDENISTAIIEFPNRPFGTHIGFVTPIAVAIDSAENVIFRGFLVEEDAVLSGNDDQIGANAFDYKWLMSKLTKLRGKLYTIDNNVRPDTGGLVQLGRVFEDVSLYEKFRYLIPASNEDFFDRKDACGFKADVRTIFNEDGNPDCATTEINSPFAPVFKYDQDPFYINYVPFHRKTADNRYWWNYATILYYISKYNIENVFEGFFNTTRVFMSRESLAKILRFGSTNGMDLIIPKHFDCNDLSPTQAINKVVKAIPGSWFWRLTYVQDSILIELDNHDSDLNENPGKSLFIGNGGKVANSENNQVNVSAIRARRSVVNSVNHAVSVGGPLEIETSLEYLPAWERYLRPITDFTDEIDADDVAYSLYVDGLVPTGYYISSFKNPTDYRRWKEYDALVDGTNEASVTGKVKETISEEDELRYSQIGRMFVFPTYKFDIIRFSGDIELATLTDQYQGYATYLHELFFTHALIPRKIKGPITNYRVTTALEEFLVEDKISNTRQKKQFKLPKIQENPPVVFLYDGKIFSRRYAEKKGLTDAQITDLMNSRTFILADKQSNTEQDLDYSFEGDNRVIVFKHAQMMKNTLSFVLWNRTDNPRFGEQPQPRKVFVTCRITCDVPIIKDRVIDRSFYGNARMVTQEIDENRLMVIRSNAYYPTPPNFTGDSLSYVEGGNRTGAISSSGRSSSSLGAPLINWNRVDNPGDAPSAMIALDDSEQLKQVIEILLGQVPKYEESFDVDLGRIDMSYLVGDRISRIVGSELEDGSGGYYGLKALVERLEYSRDGDTDTYSCRMSLINNIAPVQKKLEERKT